MPQQFANNFATQVRNTFTAVSSSLDITIGDGNRLQGLVPNTISGPNFVLLTLVRVTGGVETDWEIVRVTAQAGDTLTVSRVQEPRPGQVAVQWEVGERIEARLTRDSMNSLNVFSAVFSNQSTPVSFSFGSEFTISHNLGATPRFLQMFLSCSIAEGGYSPGNITPYFNLINFADGIHPVFIDATNAVFRVEGGMQIHNRTGGGSFDLTSANWRFFITATV